MRLLLFLASFFIYPGKINSQTTRQFFDSTWKAKSFDNPSMTFWKILPLNPSNPITINIDTSVQINKVLPTIFGVNTPFRNGNDQRQRQSIYDGTTNVLRFPAGSGSNIYFFNGVIPPSDQLTNYIDNDGLSKSIVGIEGNATEYMTPDTFVRFKQDINGEAIVVVNYFYARYGKTASGTRSSRVRQAANYAASFVRKMNRELQANIKYWEVGNECYGKWENGYQIDNPLIGTITGKEYGEDFRIFSNAMKAIDPTIKIGAVVKDVNDGWNEQVLPEIQNHADFLSVHNYFTTTNSATPNNLNTSINQISQIKIDLDWVVANYTSKPPNHFPIAMTEFNSRGSYNTGIFNALFISQVLGELIANKYGLASLWVSEWKWNNNEDESKAFLADNDPHQNQYTPRPSYVPFYYFNRCFGNQLVQSSCPYDSIKIYSSTFSSGEIGVVLINTSGQNQYVRFDVQNSVEKIGIDSIYGYEVYSDSFHPTSTGAHKKFYINGSTSTTIGGGPAKLDTVPAFISIYNRNSSLHLRPHSVQFLVIKPAMNYSFDGLVSDDWFTGGNWITGCKPPIDFKGNISIEADCVLNNNINSLVKFYGKLTINEGKKLIIK